MGLFRRDLPPPQPVRHYRKVPYTRALTASAKTLSPVPSGEKASKPKASAWQAEAWNYYDLVGELHYAATFYGACLSRCYLTPGVVGPDGKIGPAFGDPQTVDGPDGPVELGDAEPEQLHPFARVASDLLLDLRSPVGGQSSILRSFGVNLSVAGEAYLLGVREKDLPTNRWEVLSVDELRAGDREGKYRRIGQATDSKGEDLPDDALIVRVWRPHPRFSTQADSSVRPLLDILEELVILTRGVRATATSRLAGAGVYWVPDEIDYPGNDDEEGDDEDDPFTRDLIKAMMAPIEDRGSAAAVVPMVVRAASDLIGKIRHDDFSRNFDAYPSVALRGEAVQRLAQGLDLPVEIVTGQGGVNHWSAWQIDEQTFKSHIEPMLTLVCDALTVGYLHPALEAMGATPEQITDLVVHFDATELVAHPNRANDAKDAYDRLEVRGATLRTSLGFTDDDAPDEEEVSERIRRAVALRGPGAAVGGGSPGQPAGDPAQGADQVEPGPPGEAAQLAAMIAAATEVAVDRAVERAGARVRGRLNGRQDLRAALERVHNREVGINLGPALVTEIAGTDSLFAGEFTALTRAVQRWAEEVGHPNPSACAMAVFHQAEELATTRFYTQGRSVSPADFLGVVSSG